VEKGMKLTRTFLRRVLIAFLVILACAASARDGINILHRTQHEPSLGHEILAMYRLPLVAGRLSAGLPAFLSPPPIDRVRGVISPWRVGIQAGHWKIDELPAELTRLRSDTGAQWGVLSEAEVNLAIARRVALQLEEAGVVVDLLPATVPPDYDADAFVAIHADDGGGSRENGWKVAAPWRSSEASRKLRDSVAFAYALATGLPSDRYGVSYNMRGYYAFSWTRFSHAIAPATPAAIIETGFLTSAADRRIIVEDPDRAARGISLGIILFLAQRASMRPHSLVPLRYPPMSVATEQAAVRYFPYEGERITARLPAGTRVRPMNEENGWVEMVVWGKFRVFGWMRKSDLQEIQSG
jgi:N-acetylmuramoyl-L-alanine amidase